MKQLFSLLFALFLSAGLLQLIHTFPPEGRHATVIQSYIDDQEQRWLVVELDGAGYCKAKIPDKVYQMQQFKDRVRVLPFDDQQGHFLAWEGRGE